MIRLENVNKYFNRHKKNEIHVIDHTSLEFEDKGLVALLGNSGSGKTTLLNAIGGLDKINSGQIYVNGQKMKRLSTSKIDEIRNLNIGYIFQNYLLIDDMTVYENVALPLKMIGIKDKKEIKKRVEYILETVGMYKYKNRLASMLSGGERQRVGIARAIVKNPNIIIADEPTGNLDSKNSIEIMNIIKSISKDKLVILVTHEKDLAKFYASRIIQIVDGKIISDEINDHNDDLDYRMDNRIYLKDIKNHYDFEKDDIHIDCYSEEKNPIKIRLVIKNNNIYLDCDENYNIVQTDSNIEMVDEHYKKISKETYLKYQFDFNKIINQNIKLKYTSIFHPISLLTNGFKKVFNYSILKKILLIGFFISSMFITYSVSNIAGLTDIKDEKFIKTNKNYLSVLTNSVSIDDLNKEGLEHINYILPGDSIVSFEIKYNDYYQTYYSRQTLNGSLSSLNMIKESDLIAGRMPENEYEIVVDKKCLDKLINEKVPVQVGIKDINGFINRTVNIKNLNDFKIVGITDLGSPSIYTNESIFSAILINSQSEDEVYSNEEQNQLIDYQLVLNKIELKKGRLPENDYEVIVNISNEETMKLNKTIDKKVKGVNLTVVGYYYSKEQKQDYYTNANTTYYNYLDQVQNITISSNDRDATIEYYKGKKMNIVYSYDKDKKEYINSIKENIIANVTIAAVILLISLIEIYLMIRSSFLSRIKEVGILRAIGLKKRDIYKMFLGEILAITIITSILGVGIMSSIINGLTSFSYFKDQFMMNPLIIFISFAIIFIFNIIIGLLPVMNTLRKTPAGILSRNDVN